MSEALADQVVRLTARVAELEKALDFYGTHGEACVLGCTGEELDGDEICECGLDTALAAKGGE